MFHFNTSRYRSLLNKTQVVLQWVRGHCVIYQRARGHIDELRLFSASAKAPGLYWICLWQYRPFGLRTGWEETKITWSRKRVRASDYWTRLDTLWPGEICYSNDVSNAERTYLQRDLHRIGISRLLTCPVCNVG